MFHLDFNYYSLLIPFLIIGLGLGTLIFYHFQKSVSYLRIYALAMIMLGLSILLHTILHPRHLLIFLPLINGLYFLACGLHVVAIYQRLQIPVNLRCLIIFAVLGVFGNAMLSWWLDNQILRLLLIGSITTAMYLNRPRKLLRYRTNLLIDKQLKYLTIAVATIAITRAIVLSFLVDQSQVISAYDVIWGLTQLFFILIDLIFWGLFIHGSLIEVIEKLNHERDLDPLTGLLNRRAFYEYLDQLTPPRQNFIHALLIVDIDHFKQINDQYGHQVGDLALQHVSQIFRSNIRSQDSLVRLGGEEFLFLLHDTAPIVALNIAERLRSELKKHKLITPNFHIPMTISIGVSFLNEALQFEDAFYRADQFLYQAKSKGRDQVMVCDEYPISSSGI